MTKRILAAFLAIMMVVGLLPTSVFAVNAKCAVADKYDAHSKTHCDLEKVTYTKVENGTVEAACGQDGYTLYKCACGVIFADDIVRAPKQHEAKTATTAAVKPTCKDEGHVAIYTCTNEDCGKTFMKEEEITAAGANAEGVIPATGNHDYQTAGKLCTEAESKCTVCGQAEPGWTAKEEHEYAYNVPYDAATGEGCYVVKKAPTEDARGEMWFYCTNDGCEYHKVVAIEKLPHTHDMEKVDEEKTGEGCVTTTILEHYKCLKCGKLYADEAGTQEKTRAQLTIATDHKWNPEIQYVAPTCTTPGFSCYFCLACGATKGVTPETEDEALTVHPSLGHIYYKCTEHGCTTKDVCGEECIDCEECLLVKAFCKDFDDSKKAWCNTNGEITWTCGREHIDAAGNPVVCGEKKSETVTKTGHAYSEVVTIPATHSWDYKVTFQYCTNANCDDKNGNAIAKATTLTLDDGTKIPLTVIVGEDGNVYDMPADHKDISGFKVIAETVTAEKVTDKAALVHYYTDEDIVQAPTCTEPGKAFWYCQGCDVWHDKVLDPKGHKNDDTTDDQTPTCTEDGKYKCDVCGVLYGKIDKLGHNLVGNPIVYLPTCDDTQGYTAKYCDRCKQEITLANTQTSFVPNKTYLGNEELGLTAKQEFEAEHPEFAKALAAGTVDYVQYRRGSCTENGYWNATCPDCDKTYLVLIDDTGKGHSAPPVVYTKATCTQYKGYPAYQCTKCGETIPEYIEQPALGHNATKTAAKPATCTAKGNYEYWYCKTCKKYFKDDTYTTTFSSKAKTEIAKLSHVWNWTTEVDECETPGFKHQICNLGCCNGTGKGELVTGYVDAVKHDKEGRKEHLDATCIKNGYDKVYCSKCDALQEDKPIVAEGHKNAKGEIIPATCTSTVEDRVCVRCNDTKNPTFCDDDCKKELETEKNADGKYEVAKQHNVVDVIAPPSCEHYGYEGKTCANGCGEKNVTIKVEEPTGHKAPWKVDDGEGHMVDKVIKVDELDKVSVTEDVVDALNYQLDKAKGESYTAPTYETKGSFTFLCCNKCGRLITAEVIRTGVDFSIKLDNAAVAGANNIINEQDNSVEFRPVDGDVIAVEIYANAYNTDVWGFNFSMNYFAATMKYLGYVYNAADTFQTVMVHNTVEDLTILDENDVDNDGVQNEVLHQLKDAKGCVSLSAFTEKEVEGKPADQPLNGTMKVVTLYFQVQAQIDYIENALPGTDFVYGCMMSIDETFVNNAKGEEIDSTGDNAEFEVDAMLDIDGDGVAASDLLAALKIIRKLDTYKAAADADKDGDVDATDLLLIQKYINKVSLEQAQYEAIAWIAPAGFVSAK